MRTRPRRSCTNNARLVLPSPTHQSIAQLDPTHGGEVLLNGKSAEETGFTAWRTRVAYVQQKQVRLTAATGGRAYQRQVFEFFFPSLLLLVFYHHIIIFINI